MRATLFPIFSLGRMAAWAGDVHIWVDDLVGVEVRGVDFCECGSSENDYDGHRKWADNHCLQFG